MHVEVCPILAWLPYPILLHPQGVHGPWSGLGPSPALSSWFGPIWQPFRVAGRVNHESENNCFGNCLIWQSKGLSQMTPPIPPDSPQNSGFKTSWGLFRAIILTIHGPNWNWYVSTGFPVKALVSKPLWVEGHSWHGFHFFFCQKNFKYSSN